MIKCLNALIALCMTSPALACSAGTSALGTARTLAVGAPDGLNIGLKTYPQTIDLANKEVVLTFDDGPWPGTTPAILDALKAECVQATFFVIGRNAAAHPDLIRREIAEGHSVGHHSMTHPGATLRRLPVARAEADMELGFAADDRAAYGSYDGAPKVPFFRFPGFADTPELNQWLASRHIANIAADFWASDWVKRPPREQLALILSRLDRAGRGIILFHDTRAQTAAMLPEFLRALKAGGYHIVHLVPGSQTPPQRSAPPGWHSETEQTIDRLFGKRKAD